MGVCSNQLLAKSKGVHREVGSEGSWRQNSAPRNTNIIRHWIWDEFAIQNKAQLTTRTYQCKCSDLKKRGVTDIFIACHDNLKGLGEAINAGKEVRTLSCENVQLDKRYLYILQSKGPKSRRIYISEELTGYLKECDHKIGDLFPNRQAFFPNKEDKPYSAVMLEQNFYRLWYRSLPEKKDSGISGRVYDFRYPNLNKIQTF